MAALKVGSWNSFSSSYPIARIVHRKPSSSTTVSALLYLRRTHYPYQSTPLSQKRWASDSSGRSTSEPDSQTVTANSSESTLVSENPPTRSGGKKKESAGGKFNLYGDEWEDTVDFKIKSFDDLPHRLFGANQHMIINYELKEALRVMLRQFDAPIVYAFAYGSGVFPQEDNSRSITEAQFRAVHPKPSDALVKSQKGSPKMIDFIFGVTHTQHWHSINMKQHRDHYSGVASLGSGLVTRVQNWGAGVYFHPYIEMNGMLIKYGVTSIDNLVKDLSTWDSLYLAGRLQKPVKILRDHPQVRLANQHNLIAALRTALLLLPPDFTESELYSTIAGLSYLGDPRMALPTENKNKIGNIVSHNLVHFRRLYAPLVKTLPNVDFTGPCRLDDETWVLNPEADNRLQQDMSVTKRANMVRRLPPTFRSRLYFRYQKKFALPREEYQKMLKASSDDDPTSVKRRLGGEFETRIVQDTSEGIAEIVRTVIKQTVNWPSTTQSFKGLLTGGLMRSARYMREKFEKWQAGRKAKPAPTSSSNEDPVKEKPADSIDAKKAPEDEKPNGEESKKKQS